MNDKRFATPMITCNAGHVFIGDFIHCYIEEQLMMAKVNLFFKKVCAICKIGYFVLFLKCMHQCNSILVRSHTYD